MHNTHRRSTHIATRVFLAISQVVGALSGAVVGMTQPTLPGALSSLQPLIGSPAAASASAGLPAARTVSAAQALPAINGGISFAGGFLTAPPAGSSLVSDLNVFDLDSAALAVGGTGNFGTSNGLATASSFDVNGGPGSRVLFSKNGYDFYITNVISVVRTALHAQGVGVVDDIAITFDGYVTHAGNSPTQGRILFTAQGSSLPDGTGGAQAGGTASWSASISVQGVAYTSPSITSNGVLTLTKQSVSAGPGPFTITVTGASGVITTTTIMAGQPLTMTLPSGVYTVTETAANGVQTSFTASSSGAPTPVTSAAQGVVNMLNESPYPAFGPTLIAGRTFNDFNSNGEFSANGMVTDTVMPGITVTVFSTSGEVVGTAVTDASGNYALTPTAPGPYRVEFSGLPDGYEPSRSGAANGTSVQFVNTAADATGVDFAASKPCDFCQELPGLFLNFYVGGDQISGPNSAKTVLGMLPYSAGSTALPAASQPVTTSLARASQIGATWGLGYQRATKTIFAGTYFKYRTGFGPGGQGQIYSVNAGPDGVLGTAEDIVGSFVNLNTLFGAGTTGTNPFTATGSFGDSSLVGKVEFGDVDVSNDDQTLYAVNLADRKVYQIPLTGNPPVAPASAAAVTVSPAVPTTADCLVATDMRPFAVEEHNGLIYIGSICTFESAGPFTAKKPILYVWALDPATNTFGSTPVLSAPLTYTNATVGGWLTWSATSSYARIPMLTDIEFDAHGDMILALRNRGSDMNKAVTGTGDMLLACANGAGGWTLESSGDCGTRSTNWGLANGPGGDEYFNDANAEFNEMSNGGLAMLPGSNTVFNTTYDQFVLYSGSVTWFSTETGGQVKGWSTKLSPFDVTTIDGKQNALADIEMLCDPAPIEIGNRVWQDLDSDGIQDAGEPGIGGQTVTLTGPGGVISTTVTDPDGNYYFRGEAATGLYSSTLRANTAYTLSLTPPAGSALTLLNGDADTSNDSISDVRDSDASLVGGTPTIYYTTGDIGQNNHGLDFGFIKSLTATVDITNTGIAQFGDRVWLESDKDGLASTGVVTPIAGMLITATGPAGLVYTTTTDANGYYSFTVLASTYTVTHGAVPATYGLVEPSATPGGASESGNAGVYAESGNPDQSHVNNTIVTVAAGEANWEVDFAFTPVLYDLGNKIWFDTNNNGIADASEQPAPGVLIQLKNASGAVVATTTDASGYYSFTSLLPGVYTVTVAGSNFAAGGALSGYRNSDATTSSSSTATDNDKDHGINPATAAAYLSDGVSSSPITLGAGLPTGEDAVGPATPNGDAKNNQTIDFGFYKLELGNLIWEDYNNNGTVDAGEPGISGVTVELRDGNGTLISTTTTNAAGYYTFTNLLSGTYQIALPAANFATGGALAGLTSSTGANGQATGPFEPGVGESNTLSGENQDHGSVAGTLGLAGGEVRSSTFALTPGSEPVVNNVTGATQQPTIDFGLFKPAQVGNYVWYDTNHDGIQNNGTGEIGVAGVTVTLLLNGNPVSTTTTAANGSYSFTNLISGTGYAVKFDVPGTLTLTLGSTANPDDSATNSDVTGGGQTGTTDPFVLGYGEAEPDIDAGVYQPASLGDTVWFDMNGNGQQDDGEQGVPGVTATLMISTPDGFVPLGTTVTGESGYYEFNELDPNTYYVSFTLPSGLPYTWTVPLVGNTATDSNVDPATSATAPITLVSGERNPTIDGGITPYASLGNRMWDDIDHDGFQDPEEAGVVGVTVTLYKDGAPISTTTTGANGLYSFTQLVSGTYEVQFDLPAGYEFTTPTAGSGQTGMSSPDNDSNVNPAGRSTPIVLNWGEANPTIDAGIWHPMELGNRVWFDTNNDGIDNDGVEGSAGAPVTGAAMQLFEDTNNDGVLTVGIDQLISTTVTNAGGYYTFTRLVSETYFVVMPAANFADGAVLDGYLNSDPTVTGDSDQNAFDHGFATETGAIASGPITLVYGQEPTSDGDADAFTNYSIDFGYYKLSLGDVVWNDYDNDGIKDTNEPGIAGLAVSLYDITGTLVATTTTDGNGNYMFMGMAPGDYVVGVTPSAGFVSSTGAGEESDPDTDADQNDNGVTTVGGEIRSNPVTLTPDDEPVTDAAKGLSINSTVDFGIWQPASLGNYVWLDTDRDGVQDEPTANGVNSVTVTLYLDGQPVSTTVTANNPVTAQPGYYTFTNLISGSYQVQFDVPAGMTFTLKSGAVTDPANSDADMITGLSDPIAVMPNTHSPNVDAGLTPIKMSLGNQVWFDTNNDGLIDDSEQGAAGIAVQLFKDTDGNGAYTPGTDTLISTTTTIAGGWYTFTNLSEGDYSVVLPAANFAQGVGATPGGPLAGYRSSTPTTLDVNGDVNKDDNGIEANGVVASAAVKLRYNNEPTTDGAPVEDAAADGDVNSNYSVDFGFFKLEVGDLVWIDSDGDGKFEPEAGELPIAGLHVELIDAVTGDTIGATQTDANGLYTFTALLPGTYVISIPTPEGYASSPGQTLDDSGDNTDHGKPSGANIVTEPFVLTPGAEPIVDTATATTRNPNLDLGVYQPASLGNYVWNDENSNGKQDEPV